MGQVSQQHPLQAKAPQPVHTSSAETAVHRLKLHCTPDDGSMQRSERHPPMDSHHRSSSGRVRFFNTSCPWSS